MRLDHLSAYAICGKMILAHILYALRWGLKIYSFFIAFVVEMVKLIQTVHGQTFSGRMFSGQDVFSRRFGAKQYVTGRFVGLPMKILPSMPYALR